MKARAPPSSRIAPATRSRSMKASASRSDEPGVSVVRAGDVTRLRFARGPCGRYSLCTAKTSRKVFGRHTMKIDQQESLIEEVIGFAREKLKSTPQLDFTVFATDEGGRKHLLNVAPGSFSSGDAKNELADALRDEFHDKGIIRYAFIAECWVSRVAPAPVGPVTREYLERHLANYHDDYEK